jgi:hypothetical protein
MNERCGRAEHLPHEGEPVAGSLEALGVRASVFRHPLHARHPLPLEGAAGRDPRRETGA